MAARGSVDFIDGLDPRMSRGDQVPNVGLSASMDA